MTAPLKATVIDDGAFRLLAFPFGGPIPVPGAPKGADLDAQWFTRATDIKPDWLPYRLVDWHHGADETMRRTDIGKAVLDKEPTDEGWWVTVWLKAGEKRLELVRRLAERGAQLFGSSESVAGTGLVKALDGTVQPWRRDLPGEIIRWPYWRQTLSTSPQNTHSIVRPLKAALADLVDDYDGAAPADFWDTISKAIREVGSDLRATSALTAPGAPAATSVVRVDPSLSVALGRLRAASDRLAVITGSTTKD